MLESINKKNEKESEIQIRYNISLLNDVRNIFAKFIENQPMKYFIKRRATLYPNIIELFHLILASTIESKHFYQT